MDEATGRQTEAAAENKLGTFAGVFTPSILTILGIILFLRLGFVVGAGGLRQALLIILLANTISILTSISLSAIATNLKVGAGGDYYLISRTLGLQFGGALGLVLFLAQSVSIGFYCIGFGEVVAGLLGASSGAAQLIALLAIAGLFILAWLGADLATRFQFVVMGVLILALADFFLGGLLNWDSTLLRENWQPAAASPGFWALFAIFFPAVTGFTQGVSMSGDLRDPGKSLPLGTFLAVGISILVYFFGALVFAGSLPQSIMVSDYQAMTQVAWLPLLISAGVIAATLSSAMASFLGAPRILQSLATDKIFPLLNPFAQGVGPSENPRRGVLLAAAIAVLTVSLGNLNLIASVVAMFFLISYGLLNYATYFEARSASPSFRPRFKWFDQRASLAGTLVCLVAMLAIDWKAGALAVAVLFILYNYLQRADRRSRWADSRRSHHLQRLRHHLLELAQSLDHPRDWRPQILAFSNTRERRKRLLQFSAWLEGGSGLTTLVQVIEGSGAQLEQHKKAVEDEIYQDIASSSTKAFPLVVTAPNFADGSSLLLQSYGLGPVKANTILINHHGIQRQHIFAEQLIGFGRNLRSALRLGFNLVMLHADEAEWQALETQPAGQRRIDIWFQDENNGALMLLLAHLMTRSPFWAEAQLRVLTPSENGNQQATAKNLLQQLELARISAEPVVVETADRDSVIKHSADASLVLLPIIMKAGQLYDFTGESADGLLADLPLVALILAAQEIELAAGPEAGAAGLLAEAEDALAAAQNRAEQIDAEVAESTAEIETALNTLLDARQHGAEEQELSRLHEQLAKVRQQSNKAIRRSAKAEAKLEIEKQRLEQLRKQYHLAEEPEEEGEEKAD